MGYVVIAPVGDNLQALFIGMKEFPTEKVILITPKKNLTAARNLAKRLEEFTIESEIIEIDEQFMSGMFSAFGKITSEYPEEKILVNVATGDRLSSCAALSAAYANGLKAIGVMGTQTILLPIMKLNYYEQLSENKLRILRALSLKNSISLTTLKEKLGMTGSLLNYHINGNLKYRGLKEFRLVEVTENKRNLHLKLSTLGDLLMKGHIECEK